MDSDEDRRSSGRDHDLLVEIHTMIKEREKSYDQHVIDDKEHFGRLYRGQNNLRWYIGIGVGIVTAVEVFVNKIFGAGR